MEETWQYSTVDFKSVTDHEFVLLEFPHFKYIVSFPAPTRRFITCSILVHI